MQSREKFVKTLLTKTSNFKEKDIICIVGDMEEDHWESPLWGSHASKALPQALTWRIDP